MKTQDYLYNCIVCNKTLYDDNKVCSKCKTKENVLIWGNLEYDEEEISLEVVGEEPYHYQYWVDYTKSRNRDSKPIP